MRQLIALRHAKSAWSELGLVDHSRPLNQRGWDEAPRLGRRLFEAGLHPDVILVSDALRARQTYEAMAGELLPAEAPRPEVIFSHALYHADVARIRGESVGWRDRWMRVMLIAHNPGLEDLVLALTGEAVVMKTATAAVLAGAERRWSEALSGPWTLEGVWDGRE